MTPAEKGMGFRCFPIGPVFDHCQLSFKQSRFLHTARVLPSSASLICQASMAFPICCFPPRLSAQGRLDDPGTFLLVPPGCTGDTVMRDMAHNPYRARSTLLSVPYFKALLKPFYQLFFERVKNPLHFLPEKEVFCVSFLLPPASQVMRAATLKRSTALPSRIKFYHSQFFNMSLSLFYGILAASGK